MGGKADVCDTVEEPEGRREEQGLTNIPGTERLGMARASTRGVFRNMSTDGLEGFSK